MKVGLAFVIGLGCSAPALACDIISCGEAPLVLPTGADEVPINAFAFTVAHNDFLEIVLTDASTNAVIPASVKKLGPDNVWSPDAALSVGQRVFITWRTACAQGAEDLIVSAAASNDATSSLAIVGERADAPHGERFKYVTVAYEPPSTAANYLSMRVEVDGTLRSYAAYGGQFANGPHEQLFTTMCDQTPSMTDCGFTTEYLTAERHEVKFIARVLGQTQADTQTITIDLRCDAHEDDGCRLGGGSGGAWALLALWLGRRRRQGTSSPSAASTSARV